VSFDGSQAHDGSSVRTAPPLAASTPSKDVGNFRKPPGQVPKHCPVCKRFLKTAMGYTNHLNSHRWKGKYILRDLF